MSVYEKTLIGDSIPLMEVDDEESDLDYDLISKAEINADFSILVNKFGEDEFKSLFLNLINEIKILSFEDQRILCQKLLKNFTYLFDFNFFPQLSFDNIDDIDDFYKFICFLNYDYIDFLATIISGLDFELLKKDINVFLTLNWIIINERINNYQESEIISKFLRTNNKEGLFEFISSRLQKDKMLVILNSLEREW
jgi:hypothetical protein